MAKLYHAYQFIRNRIRVIIGILLVIIGAPLYILPIPLGLLFIVPGLILIFSSSQSARVKVNGFLRRHFPAIHRHFDKFCRRYCPECADVDRRPDMRR